MKIKPYLCLWLLVLMVGAQTRNFAEETAPAIVSDSNVKSDLFSSPQGSFGATLDPIIDELIRETPVLPTHTGYIDYQVIDPALSLFSSYDDTALSYVQNPQCWVAAYDWSGVAVASNKSNAGGSGHYPANKSGGVLVTPQDMLVANHVALGCNPGNFTWFVDANGKVQKAVASGLYQQVGATDIMIVHFEAPLPRTCKVYKLLPSDYFNYEGYNRTFPLVLILNFGHLAYVEDGLLAFNPGNSMYYALYKQSSSPDRKPFSWKNTGYGSSSPAFILLKNEPVFIGAVWTANALPSAADYTSQINLILANWYTSGATAHTKPDSTSTSAPNGHYFQVTTIH